LGNHDPSPALRISLVEQATNSGADSLHQIMFLRTKRAARCDAHRDFGRPVFGVEPLFGAERFRLSKQRRVSAAESIGWGVPRLEQKEWVQPRVLRGASFLICGLICAVAAARAGWCQTTAAADAGDSSTFTAIDQDDPQIGTSSAPSPGSGLAWAGMTVRHISFEGVPADRLVPLAGHLAQAEGAPLTEENLTESLRQLYATGLYDTLEVAGTPEQGGVNVIFRGAPATFIGTVGVDGAPGPTLNTQLQRASQLEAGSRLTQAKMTRAMEQMRATLEDNGYYQPAITPAVTPHSKDQLADIAYRVVSGARAHVGTVTVAGDSGMTLADFRRYARLRAGAAVDHDTSSRALDGVQKHYQGEERLEADVKLESAQYNPATKAVDYKFSANRGPVVKVVVEGASIDSDRVKRLIPIYAEGSVDEDLLNEGNRHLRDYFQGRGYFDVKVDHTVQSLGSELVTIMYTVQLGARRRVERVSIEGNHYFDTDTLKDLLSIHAADVLDRHGLYSQALVSADVSTLVALYQNNGFSQVKVTTETSTAETVAADNPVSSSAARPAAIDGSAPLSVTYRITEGPQQLVGILEIKGNDHIPTATLTSLMNTTPGQMFSPRNLAGDRDTILTEYYSRGFGQAVITVTEKPEDANQQKVDVVFDVDEGKQLFVRNVLVTGLSVTRPQTVAQGITVHAGDPLNQTALTDTQRNLYSLALFNQVNPVIVNPAGGETNKTVLLQLTEARRWTLTYGAGFEAQTGQPQNNCAGATAAGVACSPNGKTGVSPRGLAEITRNNLFGREQSASLRGTYGLLEQSIGLQYQIPHFTPDRTFGFTFSGGYANSQDVSTYVASRLEGALRVTQSFNRPGSWFSRANTFIYEIDFRRVKVAASSLQVYPGAISALSTATRVGGPAFTWIRDTRDVPMDARRGTYSSFQEFLSGRIFGAQAEFNRIDTSNSSYYAFSKARFVVARNTRYGQVRAFGPGSNGLIPLPERLYAGGAVSLRGFSQNAAGPRDPETGYQIGGAGALTNSTELRLPPPMLPFFGNTVSFVIFHDMGNVFMNAGDAWASALRIHQPDSDACRDAVVTDPKGYPTGYDPTGTGPSNSTGQHGPCSFNYFSHALGAGLRYHTPVGPIRFDVSYNLNPPIYPVNINYSIPTPANNPPGAPPGFASAPYLGQAPHVLFFFSLGQAF
jgi:outer membrane protein insertion porin family